MQKCQYRQKFPVLAATKIHVETAGICSKRSLAHMDIIITSTRAWCAKEESITIGTAVEHKKSAAFTLVGGRSEKESDD